MIFLHGGFICPVELAMAVAAIGGFSGTYWWLRCHASAIWRKVSGR